MKDSEPKTLPTELFRPWNLFHKAHIHIRLDWPWSWMEYTTNNYGKLRTARSGGSWLKNLQWCPNGQPDYGIDRETSTKGSQTFWRTNHKSADLEPFGACSRAKDDLLKDAEQGSLEEHRSVVQVEADTMQHLHHAVVGVSGVGLKVCCQQHIRLQDFRLGIAAI